MLTYILTTNLTIKGRIVINPLVVSTGLRRILLSLTLILFSSVVYSEDDIARLEVLHSSYFDMDFEHEDPLENWSIVGDQEKQLIDTVTYYEGKQSLHLSTESSLKSAPQSILSQTLNTSFERDYISLSGFIRYKNINDGGTFNVFLTTYDENNEKSISKYIEYKFKGSTDWQEFNITLPISQEVSYVNIGGILNGHGKVWLDDFIISFPKTHKDN